MRAGDDNDYDNEKVKAGNSRQRHAFPTFRQGHEALDIKWLYLSFCRRRLGILHHEMSLK